MRERRTVPPPETPTLQFCDIGKRFGPAVALHQVSLAIESGRFVTFFGPNGAGKTTLIRIAATLARPSSGTVELLGQDVRRAAPELRRHIGVVSHRSFLYGELTARENLLFFARLFSTDGAAARVVEAATAVGLEDRLDDPVRTFSRGLEQRCAIARALVHRPTILLLDEPYSGLDPVAAANLTTVLRRAHAGGRTIVITSHDLARGAELAQDVAILDRGQLRYWGAPPADLEATFAECVAGNSV
jgi:heme ABC exporter ATP-binding subunit CcmA